jgi:hypothetical protein
MAMTVQVARMKNLLGVIWGGMFVAVGSYAGVCLVLAGAPDDAASAGDSLRYALTGVAIASGAVSLWWRGRFLSSEGPATLADTDLRRHSIVVWGLSEAVAICGLVLGFVTHAANEFIPFGLAAAALLVLHRPANLPFARLRDPIA